MITGTFALCAKRLMKLTPAAEVTALFIIISHFLFEKIRRKPEWFGFPSPSFLFHAEPS
jgi:hypothetical protein